MKCTLLLMLAGLAFMTVHGNPTFNDVAVGLANIFTISPRKAEICIHKMSTTLDDLRVLEDMIVDKRKGPIDQKTVRRATCTLTCCAQAQGTMSGNKIEVGAIQSLIQNSDLPDDEKAKFNAAVNVCNDQVKTITDECEVGFEFIKCVAIESCYFTY